MTDRLDTFKMDAPETTFDSKCFLAARFAITAL